LGEENKERVKLPLDDSESFFVVAAFQVAILYILSNSLGLASAAPKHQTFLWRKAVKRIGEDKPRSTKSLEFCDLALYLGEWMLAVPCY
jgi:hypothetical protein